MVCVGSWGPTGALDCVGGGVRSSVVSGDRVGDAAAIGPGREPIGDPGKNHGRGSRQARCAPIHERHIAWRLDRVPVADGERDARRRAGDV